MVAWGGGSRGWAAILTTSAILGCDLVDKLLEGQERAARDDAVLERRAHHRVISGAGNRLGHDEREVGHTCLARGGRQVCGRAHVHLEQLRRQCLVLGHNAPLSLLEVANAPLAAGPR